MTFVFVKAGDFTWELAAMYIQRHGRSMEFGFEKVSGCAFD